MKPVRTLAAAVFLVIAAAHAARLVFRVPVLVGAFAVPLWMSAAAFFALGLLGVLLLLEGKR